MALQACCKAPSITPSLQLSVVSKSHVILCQGGPEVPRAVALPHAADCTGAECLLSSWWQPVAAKESGSSWRGAAENLRKRAEEQLKFKSLLSEKPAAVVDSLWDGWMDANLEAGAPVISNEDNREFLVSLWHELEPAMSNLRHDAIHSAAATLCSEVDKDFQWEQEISHLREAAHGLSTLRSEKLEDQILSTSNQNFREKSQDLLKRRDGVLASVLLGMAIGSFPALAAESPLGKAAESAVEQAAESAPSAPEWLGPLLLLSPLVLYGVFNLYRDSVNPQVKFVDFITLVIAGAAILNIVLISQLGVRLF